MSALLVKDCGPRTSIQDEGRFGWQRYGVAPSGAMDRLALAAANTLVGNGPGAAALEFMLLGGALTAEGARLRVAVTGAPCSLAIDGKPALHSATLLLEAGQTLMIGPMQQGVYAYCAVAGGFDLPPQLGSLSLHQRAALGGFRGRNLQAGDRIPLNGAPLDAPLLALPPLALDRDAPIRVVMGPQDDDFTKAGIEAFLAGTYRVSQEADRMGYRLEGAPIAHARGYNIVSDGIVSGSVQVPGSGQPIVMMADRQTTGGYPKIATVISADLRLVAQRRPGDAIRFAAVSAEEGEAAARERAHDMATLAARAKARRAGWPSPEEMLALNLAGAAVDAFAEP